LLLDASDGESVGSVGVSENVIEASWQALVDSIEYGMLKARSVSGRAGERATLGRVLVDGAARYCRATASAALARSRHTT